MGGKFGSWLWVICFLANLYYSIQFVFTFELFYLLNVAIVFWMVYMRFGNLENLVTWVKNDAKNELF